MRVCISIGSFPALLHVKVPYTVMQSGAHVLEPLK